MLVCVCSACENSSLWEEVVEKSWKTIHEPMMSRNPVLVKKEDWALKVVAGEVCMLYC